MRCLLRILVVVLLTIPALAQDTNSAPTPVPTPAPPPAPPSTPDNPPPDQQVIHEISGSGSTTSSFFKVNDHWEIRWNAGRVISIAVLSQDGTIVAGAAGVLRGSLYVPLGGTYYLKIAEGTAPASSLVPPPARTNAPSSTELPAASWHLQVVQVGPSVSANQALTVYTPYFVPPDTAVTPAPAEPPPPVLTTEQGQSVVKIKGANASGSGFLLRTPDGTFVLTQLHLLAANPDVKIYARDGTEIATQKLMGATDRDLAMFAVKDNNYTYLPLPTDAAGKIDSGEPLIIPDLSGHTEPLIGDSGRIVGISPERVDFDNALGPGCSGAPVIVAKDGSALAIVTTMNPLDVSESLARAWPGNPAPDSANLFPYYGIRITGVQGWEIYDPQRFLSETLFLQQFHHTTRCLDSFLHSHHHRRGNQDSGAPDMKYFLTDPKMKSAFDTYKQFATGADRNQRMEAAHELLFDLYGIAATDVATIQTMSPNLYAYNRNEAAEDLAYRTAIKKELDGLSSNLTRLDEIAREK